MNLFGRNGRNIRLFVFAFLLAITTNAQDHPPFWNDIQQFKKQDSVLMPARNQILFVGSSSFTKWKDVQQYFPAYPIINRGFGGSSLPDVIRYANDVIFAYQPKQVVIYCGENDLAGSDTVTAPTVIARFVTLFGMIRQHYPQIPIVFISLKPSPSRAHLLPKMVAVNDGVKQFLSQEKNTVYVDVYTPMLKADGQPDKDLFVEDMLHMNRKGYIIWQRLIQPHLKK